MTDLNPEGLEKAAQELCHQILGPQPLASINPMTADSFRQDARQIVSAYLAHAHPVVDTVEELDALPGRLTVMDDDGEVWQRAFSWSGAQWHMTGAPGLFHTGGIPLPARVLY